MDSLTPFNIVDIIALGVLALGAFLGYRRGLSGELARLISIVVAFVLALVFYRPVGAWVFEHTRLEPRPAQAVAFAATVVGALAAMVVLRIVLKRVMQVVFEETTDEFGGSVAGLVRTALVVIVFFMMVNTWPHEYLNEQFGEESVIGRLVLKYAPQVRAKLEDMPVTEKVKEKIRQSKEELSETIKAELKDVAPREEPKQKRWFSRD